MSQELIYSIINLAVVAVILALYFVIIMPRMEKFINIPPRFDGKVPNGDFGTFNGIGLCLLGDFRYDWRTQTMVKYEFLTLIVPLFPTNCYRAKITQEYSVNHKRHITKYKIYGTEKWHWFEVLSIYVMGFGGLALLVAVINLLQAIF